MKYYDGCPRCGRRDFGEILHCKRCNTDFCTKCQGKRKLTDGTEYACCPRCGAEIDDDDTVVVITTEKENAKKRQNKREKCLAGKNWQGFFHCIEKTQMLEVSLLVWYAVGIIRENAVK